MDMTNQMYFLGAILDEYVRNINETLGISNRLCYS